MIIPNSKNSLPPIPKKTLHAAPLLDIDPSSPSHLTLLHNSPSPLRPPSPDGPLKKTAGFKGTVCHFFKI